MTDEIPAWMKGKGTKLKGLDDVDTGKVKPWKEERDFEALSIHALPVIERPLAARPKDAKEPDWLLKGEPREVQLEALRRSYYGYALRDYPTDAERFARLRNGPARGWGHFMEMRLGKTPTLLNEFELLRRDYGFKRAIILSPNAFKRTWVSEAEAFGTSVDAEFYDGNRNQLKRLISRTKGQFLLSINYEALRSDDVLKMLEDLCGNETLIAADESITIKGHGTKVTTAALQLAGKCRARRPMTGKPITQGPHDAYTQLRFGAQLEGELYTNFKSYYCQMGGFQGKTVVGVKHPDELSAIIHSSAFVARKAGPRGWLKTPGVEYGERFIDMLPDQRALYDRMEQEFIVELENGTIVSADQIVTKLIKLQQITSGFIYDETRGVHFIVPTEKNPLLLALKTLIEEELEGKLLLVCHYQPTMDLLLKALEPYSPAVIRGQEWHRKHGRGIEEEKARFNNDPRCRVLVGQEVSLRYGHTLMGDKANPCLTEIFVENNYSLNDRSQCEQRPQGDGQMGVLSILDFFASPQALKIVRALQAKEDVAALLMGYAREEGVLPRGPVEDDRH